MSLEWGHFPLEKTTRITRDSFESQRDSHVERPEWYGMVYTSVLPLALRVILEVIGKSHQEQTS